MITSYLPPFTKTDLTSSFTALLLLVCFKLSFAQEYFRSYKDNCSALGEISVLYASDQSIRKKKVHQCNNGEFAASLYLSDYSGNQPDFSSELFIYYPPQKNITPYAIYITPGLEYSLNKNTEVGKVILYIRGSSMNPPTRTWYSSNMTPPFLPSSWNLEGEGQVYELTALRFIPNWPFLRGPLTYDCRIILFGGFSFRQSNHFINRLSHRDSKAVNADSMMFRHVLIVYRNGSGYLKMALVPFVPVSMVKEQFNELVGEKTFKFFELGKLGSLMKVMGVFYEAYKLYNDSGMAEEDKQRCARWRANGANEALRPLHCF